MMHVYNERGIFDDITGNRLKEGGYAHEFCYFDGDNSTLLFNVMIKSVNENEVVIQKIGSEKLTIPIDSIESWN